MRKTNHIWFILTAIMLISQSCSHESKEEQSETIVSEKKPVAAKDSLPEFASMNGDTISLPGKFVLFYSPDDKSFSSKKIPQDSLKFFRDMSIALMDSLKQHPEIKTAATTASYFKIYNATGSRMIITRSALKNETGILVSDGMQPPTMKTGIHPAKESYDFIKNFFFLK